MTDAPTAEKTDNEAKGLKEPALPVQSNHSIKSSDGKLDYQATFGLLPIRNEKDEIDANLSFTSYSIKPSTRKAAPRPLTFMFNGGPGSASVWLHMGGLGPRRIKMEPDGGMPVPPFEVIDNPLTWLTFTDLVFVDPVDTGYSKAASPELSEKFRAVDGDLDIDTEFIRLYLSRFNCWHQPLFLGGESYGTFRSAGIAAKAAEKGIIFNGVMLISSVLELGTLLFESGDDRPYVVYLPSYAATAWYHGQLDDELQSGTLEELLVEAQEWATSEYAVALARGANIDQETRQEVLSRLSRYTGLDQNFIDRRNLRVNGGDFCKELMASEKKVVGRLDSRHTGYDPILWSSSTSYDPSMSAIRAPFTAAINQYLGAELGYQSDDEYQILRSLDWNWGDASDGTPRTTPHLEEALARNPYMSLLVTSGYYDLATPYFATRYTLDRLNLGEEQRQRISLREYPGGHMTYVAENEMKAMRDEVEAFIARSLKVKAHRL